MQFLKSHWLTILLFIIILFLFLRNNALNQKVMNADAKETKDFIVAHEKIVLYSIGRVDRKIKGIEIKTTSDSIAQYEIVKKNGKFQNNLSHIRLLAIRDSIRKSAGYNMLNR